MANQSLLKDILGGNIVDFGAGNYAFYKGWQLEHSSVVVEVIETIEDLVQGRGGW